MQKLDAKARKEFVVEQAQQRKKIKAEIAKFSEQREKFVAEKRKSQVAASPSVSDAMTHAVKKQAAEKAFEFSLTSGKKVSDL